MCKYKYEYTVKINDGVFDIKCETRQEARETKRKWVSSDYKAKIIQRVYKLTEEKVVR